MERLENGLHDSLQFAVDLVVPDPQDAVSETPQMKVSIDVLTLLSSRAMLAAINLDDQF